MNRSNTLTLALVPILAAAACLGGCKKSEPMTPAATTSESASSPDMASSVSSMGAAAGNMAASGALGAEASASAASQ